VQSTQKAYQPTGYIGKKITAFVLDGIRYPVKSWKDMLMKVCNLMHLKYPKDFPRVLDLTGRKRPYFSKNPNELRAPERIDGTDIYAETNLSANAIVGITKKVLALFGYPDNALKIETRN